MMTLAIVVGLLVYGTLTYFMGWFTGYHEGNSDGYVAGLGDGDEMMDNEEEHTHEL